MYRTAIKESILRQKHHPVQYSEEVCRIQAPELSRYRVNPEIVINIEANKTYAMLYATVYSLDKRTVVYSTSHRLYYENDRPGDGGVYYSGAVAGEIINEIIRNGSYSLYLPKTSHGTVVPRDASYIDEEYAKLALSSDIHGSEYNGEFAHWLNTNFAADPRDLTKYAERLSDVAQDFIMAFFATR